MIEAQKAQLEKQLLDCEKAFVVEQEAKNEQFNAKKLVELDVAAVKADLDSLGGDLAKLESEKDTRNHQIGVQNDELAHQETILAKYAKEKKHLQEVNAKNADEFSSVGDRASHLNQVKQKLESTYGEIQGAYNNEKKKRANIEKETRKVQGDVKLTMEQIHDLERNRKDLESMIFKRDAEWAHMYMKYEAEQFNSAKVGKYIKELQAKAE